MISILHRKTRNELRVGYRRLGTERSAEDEAEGGRQAGAERCKISVQLLSSH